MTFPIDTEMLQTHKLEQSFKTRWFQEQLQQFTRLNPIDSETFNIPEFSLALAKQYICDKNYFYAALQLSELYDLDYDNLDGLSGFEYAIARDIPQVVFIMLALDFHKLAMNYEPLPFAVAMNSPLCFNLFLLSNQFDVNTDCFIESEFTDIAAFCGFHHHGCSFIPHVLLQQPEYHAIHKFLEIDWELGFGEDDNPLIFHAYQNGDYEMMSRLVGLGAEANPIVHSGDCYNLFHQMMWDWRDNNPDTHKGLEWFSKFSQFLTCDIGDGTPAYHFIFNREQIGSMQAKLFNFKVQDEIARENCVITDELTEVNTKLEIYETLIQLPIRLEPSSGIKPISIFADIIRTEKVMVYPAVKDIEVVGYRDKFQIAIWYQDNKFPIFLSLLPEVIFENLEDIFHTSLRDGFESLTHFQMLSIFLNLKPEAWLAINLLSTEKHIDLFKNITGIGIISYKKYWLLCRFNSFLDSDKYTTYLIDRELDKFKKVSEQLAKHVTLPGISEPDDNLADPASKRPVKINETIDGADHIWEMLVTKDQAVIPFLLCEKRSFYSTVNPNSKLVLEILHLLTKPPLAHKCASCLEVMPWYDMAYDDECVECVERINSYPTEEV